MFIKVIEANTHNEIVINTDHIVKLYKSMRPEYTAIELVDGDIDVVTHTLEELSQLLLSQSLT